MIAPCEWWRAGFRQAARLTAVMLPAWLAAAPDGPRVVSLSPSLTETICQLGLGDRLVGRSSACNWPDAVKALPACGDFGKPAIEAILRLRATHLVTADLEHQAAAATLRQAGIKVLVLPTRRLDDYYAAVTVLGRELGAAVAAADEVRRVREGVEAFRRDAGKLPEEQRPKVYLEVWDDPPMTAGKDSHIHELVAIAGGRNLGGSEPGGYFHCRTEWVVVNAPEIVIAPAMAKDRRADLGRRPGWEAIPAVRNGRVYTGLDQDAIYRLGPRLLDGLRLLRECINPEPARGSAGEDQP